MYHVLYNPLSFSTPILATVKRIQPRIIILYSDTYTHRKRVGIRIEILYRFLLDASGRIRGQILPLVPAEEYWCSSLKSTKLLCTYSVRLEAMKSKLNRIKSSLAVLAASQKTLWLLGSGSLSQKKKKKKQY